MLRLKNIHTGYGDIAVLKNVSLHVSRGEIVTLIGANGAGKTTLLNTICGLVRARSGAVVYNDREVTACSADEIVRLGISQVPEGRQIFAPLSVVDNLRLGAYVRYQTWGKKKVQERIEQMYALFPRLHERAQQYAGTLSGGEQQMLAIARALMADPDLLVLDEPSMGLAPLVVAEIFKTVTRLRDERSTTIFLVEQNARTALKYADRGYVIETGKLTLEGRSEDLLDNREVQRAYLGRQTQPIWE